MSSLGWVGRTDTSRSRTRWRRAINAAFATCAVYRPWEPWYYALGPGERWHLWVLDVDGVRVVVQSMDHAGTSEQHRTELQAIIDSIKIEP